MISTTTTTFIDENNSANTHVNSIKPKRRGRPPSKKKPEQTKLPKKRGRKPKGGQIISTNIASLTNTETKENIVVHLKCSTSAIKKGSASADALFLSQNGNHHTTIAQNNKDICDVINKDKHNHATMNDQTVSYFNLKKETVKINTMFEKASAQMMGKTDTAVIENIMIPTNNISDQKCDECEKKKKQEKCILEKLKILQTNMKTDNICHSDSNCFWCTYSFENPPIHIPKYIIKNNYHVYGCFCSPECATAYLFNENIDNATRIERYSLLCSLYAKVFKYDKNIKPAPNPFYTLDKYCGSLSIMEYRELFNSNRFLFVIEKPITRDLPELDIVDDSNFC